MGERRVPPNHNQSVKMATKNKYRLVFCNSHQEDLLTAIHHGLQYCRLQSALNKDEVGRDICESACVLMAKVFLRTCIDDDKPRVGYDVAYVIQEKGCKVYFWVNQEGLIEICL